MAYHRVILMRPAGGTVGVKSVSPAPRRSMRRTLLPRCGQRSLFPAEPGVAVLGPCPRIARIRSRRNYDAGFRGEASSEVALQNVIRSASWIIRGLNKLPESPPRGSSEPKLEADAEAEGNTGM